VCRPAGEDNADVGVIASNVLAQLILVRAIQLVDWLNAFERVVEAQYVIVDVEPYLGREVFDEALRCRLGFGRS